MIGGGGQTAILALGKNWELPIPPDPAAIELSVESKITAEAAGVLFTRGAGNMIIFSAGRTAGPGYPSESSEMREELHEQFTEYEVPVGTAIVEEESYDTRSGMEETERLLEAYNIADLVLVTIAHHLPRAVNLAKDRGLPVREAYRAQDLIRERHGGRRNMYARMVAAQAVERHSAKPILRAVSSIGMEVGAWGLLALGPSAEGITDTLARKLRHQA